MQRVCVLVGFALDEEGLANRRAQLDEVRIGPGYEFAFKAVKAGPAFYDSHHDHLLADVVMLEAGVEAAREGFDAICIDSMSDSGVKALRSVLDIPVLAPAKLSYLTALMLGTRFSVLTQWDGWIPGLTRGVHEYGLQHACASVRSIGVLPDVRNLLGGREDVIFPRLVEEGHRCIGDGADVICLGSTTLHEAHAHLSEQLPVPVINPGPLTYKLAQLMLETGLRHSELAYGRPRAPMLDAVQAMVAAAVPLDPRARQEA
jgi:Asp/Glu/hydantoin racemase